MFTVILHGCKLDAYISNQKEKKGKKRNFMNINAYIFLLCKLTNFSYKMATIKNVLNFHIYGTANVQDKAH